MLSRKHYEAIAKTISDARNTMPPQMSDDVSLESAWCGGGEDLTDHIMLGLAAQFERDNPRFDRYKFLKACRV